MEPITGIILAGGNSSRMGADKALIQWKGISFLERIIANLEPVCDQIFIVGDRPPYHRFGVEVIPDQIDNAGPLAGIYSGLIHSDTDLNFVIPCDMPFLRSSLIQRIIHSQADKKIVIPVVNSRPQFLSGVYPRPVNESLHEMLGMGIRKVSLVIESMDVQRYIVTAQDADQFRNINFRKDLEEL